MLRQMRGASRVITALAGTVVVAAAIVWSAIGTMMPPDGYGSG